MIILTCQLIFDKGGERILSSVVYDDVTDRFVRTAQRISPELVQDLSSNNPMVDINDVVSLDYVEYILDDEELEEVIEMVEDGPDNDIIKKATESFLIQKNLDKMNEQKNEVVLQELQVKSKELEVKSKEIESLKKKIEELEATRKARLVGTSLESADCAILRVLYTRLSNNIRDLEDRNLTLEENLVSRGAP
jgi:hypothetical protein